MVHLIEISFYIRVIVHIPVATDLFVFHLLRSCILHDTHRTSTTIILDNPVFPRFGSLTDELTSRDKFLGLTPKLIAQSCLIKDASKSAYKQSSFIPNNSKIWLIYCINDTSLYRINTVFISQWTNAILDFYKQTIKRWRTIDYFNTRIQAIRAIVDRIASIFSHNLGKILVPDARASIGFFKFKNQFSFTFPKTSLPYKSEGLRRNNRVQIVR